MISRPVLSICFTVTRSPSAQAFRKPAIWAGSTAWLGECLRIELGEDTEAGEGNLVSCSVDTDPAGDSTDAEE